MLLLKTFLLVHEDFMSPLTFEKRNKTMSFELRAQLSILIYSRLYFEFHKVFLLVELPRIFSLTFILGRPRDVIP